MAISFNLLRLNSDFPFIIGLCHWLLLIRWVVKPYRTVWCFQGDYKLSHLRTVQFPELRWRALVECPQISRTSRTLMCTLDAQQRKRMRTPSRKASLAKTGLPFRLNSYACNQGLTARARTHHSFRTIFSSSCRYFCLSCSTRTRWRCTGSSNLFIVSITLLLISCSAFLIIAFSSSWFCSCWTKEITLYQLLPGW